MDWIPLEADVVHFVADTHFRDPDDPGERGRRRRFAALLDAIEPGAALVLLGDIFDFYFEYRSVVPGRYLDVYEAIRRCSARGVDVRFVGGNHDYWVGPRFARALGLTLHDPVLPLSVQGRRVVCAHGDLHMPGDPGYRVLRAVLRNRLVIGATRWIHPDLLDAVAAAVAHGSRSVPRRAQDARAREVAEHAFAGAFVDGADLFVMGHVHWPYTERRGEREVVIVGDWIRHFTWAQLEDGAVRLRTAPEEPAATAGA